MHDCGGGDLSENNVTTNADDVARRVGDALLARKMQLATAESCTGGGIGKVVTDIAGSSVWFDCGFITYSNASKHDLLGVQLATLEVHGAVSEATVREMAQGALARSRADVTLAVTGIAGPGGGSPDKPVGLVWFAWSVRNGATHAARELFSGDRAAVREQSVIRALRGVLDIIA